MGNKGLSFKNDLFFFNVQNEISNEIKIIRNTLMKFHRNYLVFLLYRWKKTFDLESPWILPNSEPNMSSFISYKVNKYMFQFLGWTLIYTFILTEVVCLSFFYVEEKHLLRLGL